MAQELIYTSVPRGLKPGSCGFSTVFHTEGMLPNMTARLESLSGYNQLFPMGSPERYLNPVAWSHVKLTIGEERVSVISRVADADADYTGRTNMFAHHIVLKRNELAPGGPAYLLGQPGFMASAYNEEPRRAPFTRVIPTGISTPHTCSNWAQITGDPGWGGALAQTAQTGGVAAIIFSPGMDMLALIEEAMALLPQSIRWNVTFNTYFTRAAAGIEYQWRCAVAGTEGERAAKAGAAITIDLTQITEAPTPSPWVNAARTGIVPQELVRSESKSPMIRSPRQPKAVSPPVPARTAPQSEAAEGLSAMEPTRTPVDYPSNFNMNGVLPSPPPRQNDRKSALLSFPAWLSIALLILVGINICTCVWYTLLHRNTLEAFNKIVEVQGMKMEDLNAAMEVQGKRMDDLNTAVEEWNQKIDSLNNTVAAQGNDILELKSPSQLFLDQSQPKAIVEKTRAVTDTNGAPKETRAVTDTNDAPSVSLERDQNDENNTTAASANISPSSSNRINDNVNDRKPIEGQKNSNKSDSNGNQSPSQKEKNKTDNSIITRSRSIDVDVMENKSGTLKFVPNAFSQNIDLVFQFKLEDGNTEDTCLKIDDASSQELEKVHVDTASLPINYVYSFSLKGKSDVILKCNLKVEIVKKVCIIKCTIIECNYSLKDDNKIFKLHITVTPAAP